MDPFLTDFRDESKQGCKDQESIQSSTTPDPGYQWESDKLTEDTTNESQEVSPFPAGDHKAQINRRAQRHNKHNIENTHKISTKALLHFTGKMISENIAGSILATQTQRQKWYKEFNTGCLNLKNLFTEEK